MPSIARRVCLVLALLPCIGFADTSPFTGVWSIDLRSAEEKALKTQCGSATFELTQSGSKITGNHYFSTPRCVRMNEGGEGTVKGVVIGTTAVLVVTSGRNGAIVLGNAKLNRGALEWQTLEDIKEGEPPNDTPLILGKGTLLRMDN
jgi:hypothetical protein